VPESGFLHRSADLILCAVLAVAATVVTILSIDSVVRVALGLLLVLIVPGYALSCLFWGSASRITAADRIAFTGGLSVGLVIFTLLFLSVSGIGFDPLTVSVSLMYEALAFCITAAAFRWKRQEGIPSDILQAVGRLRHTFRSDRLFWSSVTAFLVAATLIVVLIVVSPEPPNSVAFYVVGPDGTTATLPQTMVVNKTSQVIVGTYNGLGQDTLFEVTVCLTAVNGTCANGPARAANWTSVLFLSLNSSYLLNLNVASGASAKLPMDFAISVPGNYVLSIALDGGGVHQDTHLPLSVSP
jgi:uncharacterized membrane protein